MPQIPIIVPVIVLAMIVGSILRSKNIPSKKKIAASSLLSGLLNAAYAFILNMVNPPQNLPQGSIQILSTSEVAFVSASFLTGVMMVLAVLAIAAIYLRLRGTEEIEEITELAK